MTRLEGKVAIITGAAISLGAEIATRLASEGAMAIVCDIVDANGAAIAEKLRGEGRTAEFVHLNVAEESEWETAIRGVLELHGRLDVLVNNAGVFVDRKPIEAMTAENWDRIMAINLRSVFLGTKHAIPAMRRGGGGSIINISSIAGIGQSQIQEPAYAASKAAVRMLSRVTAAQHAHENIRCNSVHPGPIDSGMLHRFMPTPEALANRLKRVPMGRLGKLEEIAAGVAFLASDDASYVTGSELVIDGGALVQ